MNLYTTTYEATQPAPKAVQVPLNSKYAVGVGLDFQGKPAEVTRDNVLLDGLSADGYFNSMAVFNLSSDGTEGREVHEVTTAQEGVASKHLLYHNETTLTSGKGVLSGSIADWEGVELYCNQTPSSTYDYSKNPFQAVARKANGTEKWGQMTYFCDKDRTKVYAIINNKTEGFTDNYQNFMINKPDGSGVYESDHWTVPPDCYVYINISLASSYLSAEVNTEYVEKFKGSYKLFIDKKDMGVAEGWLDNQVDYGQTITLSGTYSDDTSFDFEVPTKA